MLGALQTQSDSHTGALKLLDELDTMSGLIGTDLAKSDVTQSVKTTTSHSKTVKLSKISSPYHGLLFETAAKTNHLNTTTGVYTDPAGKSYNIAEAFEKDLINPDSAVFINPRDGQSMTLHNAIQRELVGKNGHYREASSGRKYDLNDCIAKSIVVAREVEPIAVHEQEKEEHYKFHVDKVGGGNCWIVVGKNFSEGEQILV